MAGPGGGPSRRSHTKSRKGCKTCKRRHIRCDETFPQCRNCTKHQVRCDYMDSPPTGSDEASAGPHTPNLLWTPEIDAIIEAWRQTGEFPFPELHVYPQPQWHAYSKTDLRLIHHLCFISNDMHRSRTSKLTLWTDHLPKFLSIASTNPFVMHAILAFSAAHLAWISQSSETRSLAFQHGGVALKGLHEAIGNFSKANADAVLASSLLLSWQATDWRGWTSLVTGTRTVGLVTPQDTNATLTQRQIISSMQPWRQESLFADFLATEAFSTGGSLANPTGYRVTQEARRDHLATLQHIHSSLQRLQPYLNNAHYEQESTWIDQLRGYIERLRSTSAPQSAGEQFQQLYALRKWLFWVPVSLLSRRKGDILMLVVLAHFYAAALALEPMFPDIGAPFCSNMSLAPLEEIIRIINTLQSQQGFNQTVQAATIMMEFPREACSGFRNRREWMQQQSSMSSVKLESPYGLDSLNADLGNQIQEYGYGASLSPAFAPSPLNLSVPSGSGLGGQPSPLPQPSPFLEVPRSAFGGGGSAGGGGAYGTTPLGSPSAPPPGYMQDESMFNYGLGFGAGGGYPGGGFVPPQTAWT